VRLSITRGAIDAPHLPPTLLDSVALRFENGGLSQHDGSERDQFRVSHAADDAEDAPPSSYRVPDGRARMVVVRAANAATALAAGFDELRLWQKGARSLAYEVRYGRWFRTLRTRLVAAVVAGMLGVLLPAVAHMVPPRALVTGAILVGLFVTVIPAMLLASHRRRLRVLVETVVLEEIHSPFAARVAEATPAEEGWDDLDAEDSVASGRAGER
jgi:hypothetical protein